MSDAGHDDEAVPEVDELLDTAGFDPERSVLTRRQAEVLALREQGVRQSTIADYLGTSRANVSSVEASARANVEKARETVTFVDALTAPVRIEVPIGSDLYDVPKQVYDACDDAGVKVNQTAPDLMKIVSDAAGEAVQGREIKEPLFVGVTSDGRVRVRRHADRS
ncbi:MULTISPECIES: Tfx family DNA-binding protein [Haloferax]|uniref:Tfx family DNA-binding protein n=1 Tax=Haloferax marinum TaxID=2666143 RepID=A0A6A8G5Y4_9EURY|nr:MULTISPECIES: Tfx family DNA-binding protein [Haloferax]KAB1197446.1 Tfx family DNA-binding protein [Haloferax sp. CBA1150]MRW96491.1 Tfx family DNA-binding protein [Haloferax marinum]